MAASAGGPNPGSSNPRRRHNPKQRLKSSLIALTAVCLVVFLGGALVQIDSVSPGRIDTHAAKQIRQRCIAGASCTIRLGDLIPGAWDTFYEFNPSVPRTELSSVLKHPEIRTAPKQRVLVLMQDGQILRRQYAHTGQAQPLAGEIVFAGANSSAHPDWVVYTPGTRFQVTPCDTREGGSAFGAHGGTYFLLTPLPSLAANTAACTEIR